MKRILVATDGSDGADRAVDIAAEMAGGSDEELIIASVEQGYFRDGCEKVSIADNATVEESLNAVSVDILKHAEERARRKGVSRIRVFPGIGDAAGFILEIAERENVQTIVVGRRGRGRLAGLLLGSVSRKLVSLARCTVVVVP